MQSLASFPLKVRQWKPPEIKRTEEPVTFGNLKIGKLPTVVRSGEAREVKQFGYSPRFIPCHLLLLLPADRSKAVMCHIRKNDDPSTMLDRVNVNFIPVPDQKIFPYKADVDVLHIYHAVSNFLSENPNTQRSRIDAALQWRGYRNVSHICLNEEVPLDRNYYLDLSQEQLIILPGNENLKTGNFALDISRRDITSDLSLRTDLWSKLE